MKISEIAKRLDFNPDDIRKIMIQGRYYRPIYMKGNNKVNWGEIDLGVEIFIPPNMITLIFEEYSKPIYPHWLGLDKIRYLNDEQYAKDLKENW